MQRLPDINFDQYLTSLVSKYERSQDCYTQTDAASLFDFGLMAQTVREQNYIAVHCFVKLAIAFL